MIISIIIIDRGKQKTFQFKYLTGHATNLVPPAMTGLWMKLKKKKNSVLSKLVSEGVGNLE